MKKQGGIAMRLSDEKAFAVIEVFIVMLVCVIAILAIWGVVFRANFWCTQGGVLQALQAEYPDAKIEKVMKMNRNIIRYSEVEVETKEGSRLIYELDTNVLWNYNFPE